MKGSLSAAMLMYLGTAWQRRLIGIAVLLYVGERLLRQGLFCHCRHSYLAWIPLQMIAIGCLAASGFLGAWQFRRIWSQRTVWLIPGARARLLGALLAAQVAFAVALTALNVMTHAGLPVLHANWSGIGSTFETAFALAMLYALGIIVLLGPSRVASVALICAVGVYGINPEFFMRSDVAGYKGADTLMVAAVAALALFGIWFLRSGPAPSPFANWAGSWSSSRIGRLVSLGRPTQDSRRDSPRVSRLAAIEAYLLGRESMWRACQSWLINCAIYNLVLIMTQAARAKYVPHPDFTVAPLMLTFFVGLIINALAGQIARGSRSLWLQGGCSRAQLFASAERLAGRCLIAIGIPLYFISGLEWRFLPTVLQAAPYMVAASAGLALCGMYLGLLNFKQRLDPSFLALYAAAIPLALLPDYLSKTPEMPVAWWGVPIGLGFAALALRFLAMRRWMHIDWWRYKPARQPSWVLRTNRS